MYITDIVYLLDVLVVIVYMSYCNCWDYLLFFFPTKICSWGSETHANKNLFFGGGGGGGFGVFGALHAPTRGSCEVGKQYTSSYDHDM